MTVYPLNAQRRFDVRRRRNDVVPLQHVWLLGYVKILSSKLEMELDFLRETDYMINLLKQFLIRFLL